VIEKNNSKQLSMSFPNQSTVNSATECRLVIIAEHSRGLGEPSLARGRLEKEGMVGCGWLLSSLNEDGLKSNMFQ
jgi:hypothetical protein